MLINSSGRGSVSIIVMIIVMRIPVMMAVMVMSVVVIVVIVVVSVIIIPIEGFPGIPVRRIISPVPGRTINYISRCINICNYRPGCYFHVGGFGNNNSFALNYLFIG